ncbi:hypothetical protein [Agromyces sp. NPDC058104]|uniref:hypothetical protein n=1 Tax=Agromyces sp. NPDC058104 TaxID=3346342 RepID=UPI0036D8A904
MSGDQYEYTPRLAAPYWAELESFVTEVVGAANGTTVYSPKELSAAVGPLALWAWQSAGLTLDVDSVLNRRTIERFVAFGMPQYSRAGKGTMRSRLLRVSEVLLPEDPSAPMRPYGKADASAPYTLREQASFRSWALAQGTALRRVNGDVLLALGFGAGLSNEELIAVRCGDIDAREYVTVGVIGDRARTVPVLAEWDYVLRESVRLGRPDEWAFLPGRNYRGANLTGHFIRKSNGSPPLTVRRMHATWILHHIDRGTPLVPLLAAAGLSTVEPLDRFLKHAARPSEADAIAALR